MIEDKKVQRDTLEHMLILLYLVDVDLLAGAHAAHRLG